MAILGEGVKARAGELEALNRRDFYLDRYFDPEKGKG